MPPPKKKGGDLGKALVRSRFQGRDPRKEYSGHHSTDLDDGYDWAKMGSITQQGDLDEFLSTAEMAGTDFTAEKLNVQLILTDHSAEKKERERRATAAAHSANRHRLRIPRRPPWTRKTTAEELHAAEKDSFLEWRRTLAELEAEDQVIMTPYERNLEFWRQLWRVIERSDVVVQIVDARNPLLFRCADLELYVKEVDPAKRTVLLLNKSDFLSPELRAEWGAYLDSIGVEFAFFSAKMETEKADAQAAAAAAATDTLDHLGGPMLRDDDAVITDGGATGEAHVGGESDDDAGQSNDNGDGQAEAEAEVETAGTAPPSDVTIVPPPSKEELAATLPMRCRLKSCNDLLGYLQAVALAVRGTDDGEKPPTIGMVGYPNVGKSSTVNALCAEKKVPVSSTPGRTRHFQTLELGGITLCDCPGLVFPSFASTKAEMVCFGILPIDQLTGYLDPVDYIAQTVARDVLNKTYGISIIAPGPGEDPHRRPSAQELIDGYGLARGIMSGSGDANGPQCARILLKDFVDGKLLYCKPPPGHHDASDAAGAATTSGTADGASASRDNLVAVGPAHDRRYVDRVDLDFFGDTGSRALVRDRAAGAASAQDMKPTAGGKPSKKHFKGGRKEKTRRRAESAKGTAGFVSL
eukprot:m.85154 g.85154  ORF g.85154 m.85154 type:complete len:638 (-) comp9621_c1_seq1:109-2022(-)